MNKEQDSQSAISQAILSAFTPQELRSMSEAQGNLLDNLISKQIDRSGLESLTPERMKGIKETLAHLWDQSFDASLSPQLVR